MQEVDYADQIFFPARLATLSYWLDSDVAKLLANLLTKPSILLFCQLYFVVFFSIKIIIIICSWLIRCGRLTSARLADFQLDGWCKVAFLGGRNDCGSVMTMHEG